MPMMTSRPTYPGREGASSLTAGIFGNPAGRSDFKDRTYTLQHGHYAGAAQVGRIPRTARWAA
jgi:hypothetical protein